jgi:hypothetical protein
MGTGWIGTGAAKRILGLSAHGSALRVARHAGLTVVQTRSGWRLRESEIRELAERRRLAAAIVLDES